MAGKTAIQKVPIIGSMFGGAPDITPVDLDQGTKDLIHEGAQRSINESPQDIQGQILNGVGNANEGMNQTPHQLGQEAVRTGQDPALMQAISNRYRQMNTQDLARFKSQSDIQARYVKGQRMAQMSQAAMAQQQVQTNNYTMLAEAYQQNEMARSQVVQSIIGAGNQAYSQHNGRQQANAGSQRYTVDNSAPQEEMGNYSYYPPNMA